tara:strand:+ start:650 stop:2407 length:1758 start_codon:yes stop_codon:yes gene_type:complete
MNQLNQAHSPYLRQHKDNPVEWHTWSEETLQKAKRENRPILLSGGYSACHWCHVMAHESFEDADTARLMNENFINIKLDREEHPDVDHIYQQALSLMGEPGGWPLTMFLTPEGLPFFGGTYFPPEPKFGRPSFQQILNGVADSWKNEHETVQYNVEALKTALNQESVSKSGPLPDMAVIEKTMQKIISGFDPKHGGFGSSPKFPQAPLLMALAAFAQVSDDDIYSKALLISLDNICQGGIYDHLGGGFFRYSTDTHWMVPHFEKMLYDNALMIRLLCLGYKINPSRLYAARIEETIEFLMRDMQVDGGPSFAAAMDADSDGKEGAYYVWTYDEVEAVLGIDAPDFAKIYDVRKDGNWNGQNVLNRLKHQGVFNPKREGQLSDMRQKMLEKRRTRTAPARDDKILTDWNAMIAVALIEAAETLGRDDWKQHAHQIFNALDGDLHHCRIDGHVTAPALLDDYAWMALLSTKLGKMNRAHAYLNSVETRFLDTEDGGYFTTDTAKNSPVRLKTINDTATPSANAVLMETLYILADQGHQEHAGRLDALMCAFAGELDLAPYAMGGYIRTAINFLNSPSGHCNTPPCKV